MKEKPGKDKTVRGAAGRKHRDGVNKPGLTDLFAAAAGV